MMIDGTQMFRDGAGNYRPFGWLVLLVLTSLLVGLVVAGVLPPEHAIALP